MALRNEVVMPVFGRNGRQLDIWGQTTAVTPTACMANGSVAGSFGRVVPRGRRHELLSLWGLRFLTE